MSIVLTQEQSLFIEKALDGNNILVDACIGSGKTTSIQHLCQQFPFSKNILYLTYNRLLKIDAKSKIHGKNITVTNYHGFAYSTLKKAGISCGITDIIQTFIREKPRFPIYDVLVIDEYQDIDLELSTLLEIVKASNPSMQIIAVGDMQQKIYDKTTLNVADFIKRFLGNYICLFFTQCFRLNFAHAAMLGRIWNKSIIGVNESCKVCQMTEQEVIQFIASQKPEDILCLGPRLGAMPRVLNRLETDYPEKFNKRTVYASIADYDDGGSIDPKWNSAIFTTYDSSKGLERKNCIVFGFEESYWSSRVKKPQQSYEILRNIFCVAASRGKDRIIFVKTDEELLSEKTLATPVDNQVQLKTVAFSEMFDFKYKESIEKCYNLLKLKKIPLEDNSSIHIKTNDELIDLSPCVGVYQEASFFNEYNIDKEIELYLKIHYQLNCFYTDTIKQSSVAEKVLFLTAMETNYMRYMNQVAVPYITAEEERALHKRLSSVFSKDDCSQASCIKNFDNLPNRSFMACGFADVVKDDTVYELKFVSELKHEHFLQCACYVIALHLKKGILWNTRNNEMYEISIPNEEAFCLEVAKTVLKIPDSNIGVNNTISEEREQESKYPIVSNSAATKSGCFAIIDVETTWSDRVMSIGLCVVKKESYECVDQKYYIIVPEAKESGMYSGRLKIQEHTTPIECSRAEALQHIKAVVNSYKITDMFAYRASYDSSHLSEIDYVSWYDIMKIAPYKQFNSHIPHDADCCSTGRLKKDYSAEHMIRLVSGNDHYYEKHNACCDAYDEALLMKMLCVPYQVYIENALIKTASSNLSISFEESSVPSEVLLNSTNEDCATVHSEQKPPFKETEKHREHLENDTIFADEAAGLLHVSKSTVYNLIKCGAISARKIGNKYHISKQSVLSYIEHMAEMEQKQHEMFIALAVGVGVFLLILFLFFGLGF